MTPLSIACRLLAGLALVVAVVAAGYGHRSIWMIGLLGLAFALIDTLAKWSRWRRKWREGGAWSVLKLAPAHLLSQVVLVGLLFLVGYGLGSLISPGRPSVPASRADVVYALWVVGLGSGLGLMANFLERKSPMRELLDLDPDELTERLFQEIDTRLFELRDEPITTRNFFEDELVGVGEHEFLDAKVRLGFELPASLAALYRQSDGGATGDLYLPRVEDPGAEYDDWIRAVPGGFLDGIDELVPRPSSDGRQVDVTLASDGDERLELVCDLASMDISVRVFGLDSSGEPREPLRLPSFDAFLRALRRAE